ncbi:MAG: hypothetical protein LAO30_10590 [Acidobacteriia bacterium]|nr:hypothetical protein [Terriglobia bacterium]
MSKNVYFPRRLGRRLHGSGFSTSGGGHTLRYYDLGMIFAGHGNGVSDCEHSVDVMN